MHHGDQGSDIWERYGAYLETQPEYVFEWHDAQSEAKGWLVVNSLRGGAAGGGTRMRTGVTREEVTYLAKVMQLKFAFSGPPIGGGKSGIDFDPADPRREDVLRRWFAAVRPFLTTHYGTGGDVNVDEQRDVVRLCAAMGVAHPQEGIVRGHMRAEGDDVQARFASLRNGICQPAGPRFGVDGLDFTVSDLITGYGVARAAERFYEHRAETLDGVRCLIEGFGNVGAAAALYLARRGARITGIIDHQSGLTTAEGLDADDVECLLRDRTERALPPHPLRIQGPEKELAYRCDADLFIPAAISGSVDSRRLGQLTRHGCRRIVCGANQPFHEVRLGDTLTAQAADAAAEVMPEVVASLGMARTFYYLMANPGDHTADDVFEAVGSAVDEAADAVMERVGRERLGVMAAALGIAMERTME